MVPHLHPQLSKHSTDWISFPLTPLAMYVCAVYNLLNCPWQPTAPASAYVDEDRGLYGVEWKAGGCQHRQLTQGPGRPQPRCLDTG